MNITFKQLRYFVALAETGSFGMAAEMSHVSQPALSVQIRELEGRLGAQLIDRLPRGITLTRTGRDVLDRARRVLAEAGDLEQAVRWSSGLKGRIALGAIPTVAPYLLPAALSALRRSDNDIDVRIREAQTDVLLDAVSSAQLDAAVIALPVEGGTLVAEPLFEDRFILAGSNDVLNRMNAAPERLRPDRIDPDQLLLLDEGHCLADQALEVCGLPSRRKVDLGASSLSTLSGIVAEGHGLTLLPELSLRSECAATPHLSIARFAAPEPARTIGLVYRKSASSSEWVETLGALLAQAGATLIAHARATYPP